MVELLEGIVSLSSRVRLRGELVPMLSDLSKLTQDQEEQLELTSSYCLLSLIGSKNVAGMIFKQNPRVD